MQSLVTQVGFAGFRFDFTKGYPHTHVPHPQTRTHTRARAHTHTRPAPSCAAALRSTQLMEVRFGLKRYAPQYVKQFLSAFPPLTFAVGEYWDGDTQQVLPAICLCLPCAPVSLLGVAFRKAFGRQGTFVGTVVAHDSALGYHLEYLDGDEEDVGGLHVAVHDAHRVEVGQGRGDGFAHGDGIGDAQG